MTEKTEKAVTNAEGRYADAQEAFEAIRSETRTHQLYFEQIEKRIEDGQKYVFHALTLIGGVLSAVLVIASLVIGIKFESEISRLEDLENEVTQQVDDATTKMRGEISSILYMNKDRSDLKILASDGKQLKDNIVEAKFKDRSEKQISFPLFLKNDGDSFANLTFIKVYSNEIELQHTSIDYHDFHYETSIPKGEIHLTDIPQKSSQLFFIYPSLGNDYDINAGRYSMRIKVFYGREKTAEADFTIDFRKDYQLPVRSKEIGNSLPTDTGNASIAGGA